MAIDEAVSAYRLPAAQTCCRRYGRLEKVEYVFACLASLTTLSSLLVGLTPLKVYYEALALRLLDV